MKIAFIDSRPERREKFKNVIDEYYNLQNIKAEVDLYTDSHDLIEKIKNGAGYCILFIDVTCGELTAYDIEANGIVPEIRRYNPFVPIIFTNWINNKTIECIFVHPQHFMLNPLNKESFFPMMNSISEQILYSPARTINVKTTDKNIHMVSVGEIVYAEVTDHTITIHLCSSETIEISETMKNLTEHLTNYPEFLKPHRSFIVNSIFISHISAKEICLKTSDKKIPVAKGKAESIKQEYKDFFAKYQVLPYSAKFKMAEIDF